MSMTFEELKKQYPNPTGAHEVRRNDDSYCVGGAFCLGIRGTKTRFPFPFQLRNALQKYNPVLPIDEARAFAIRITNTNDSRNIDGAWNALDQAMNYKAEGEA